MRARKPRARPRKPAVHPPFMSFEDMPFGVHGHAQVVFLPFYRPLPVAVWYLPLRVIRADLHPDPNQEEESAGSFSFVSDYVMGLYLEMLIQKNEELAELPPLQLKIAGFFPEAFDSGVAKRAMAKQVATYKTTLVWVIRIDYGLAVEDIVPLYDAGLLPDPVTDADRVIASGPNFFDVKQAGHTTRITVDALLKDDLGYLMDATIIGCHAEYFTWPAANVCRYVGHLSEAGEAFLYEMVSHADDLDIKNDPKAIVNVTADAEKFAKSIRRPISLQTIQDALKNDRDVGKSLCR